MPDNSSQNDWSNQEVPFRHIDRQVERKIRARKYKEKKSIWFGLGMFGLVGWAVAIPTLIGVGLGIWLDARSQSSFSWILTLLVTGIVLGCFNAWYWITRERDRIYRERGQSDE